MDTTKEITCICAELKVDFFNILTLILKAMEILEELEIIPEEREEFKAYLNGFYSNLSQAEYLLLEEEKILYTKTPEIQLKQMNDLLTKMTFICSDAHFALEEDEEDEIYEASFLLLEKLKKKQLLLSFLPQIEQWSAAVDELYYSAKELLVPFIQKRMSALIKDQPIEITEADLQAQLDPLLVTIEKIKNIWDEAKLYETIGEEKMDAHLRQIERRWQDLCFRAFPLLYQLSECWLKQAISNRELLEKNIAFLKEISKKLEEDSPRFFDRIKENLRKLEKQKALLKEEKPQISYFDFFIPNFIKIPWFTSGSLESANPPISPKPLKP